MFKVWDIKLQQRVPQLEDVFVFPEVCQAPENLRIKSFNYRVSELLCNYSIAITAIRAFSPE